MDEHEFEIIKNQIVEIFSGGLRIPEFSRKPLYKYRTIVAPSSIGFAYFVMVNKICEPLEKEHPELFEYEEARYVRTRIAVRELLDQVIWENAFLTRKLKEDLLSRERRGNPRKGEVEMPTTLPNRYALIALAEFFLNPFVVRLLEEYTRRPDECLLLRDTCYEVIVRSLQQVYDAVKFKRIVHERIGKKRLMIVEFEKDGATLRWIPKWKDLLMIAKDAVLTETFNQSRGKKNAKWLEVVTEAYEFVEKLGG